MIAHCLNCRLNGQQDWDTSNNRCKGLDRAEDDDRDPPQPCRFATEYGTTYRHFLPVDEYCAEDVLDRLLPQFDALEFRLGRIERALKKAVG